MADRHARWRRRGGHRRRHPLGKADPNQRLIGLTSRFLRPGLVILIGVGLLATRLDLTPGDKLSQLNVGPFDLGWDFTTDSQALRLGIGLLAIGVLWTVAVGFALGTLRLVAAMTMLVLVFLLTGVGGATQRGLDADAVEALSGELQVEFNLLRGPRTTRGDVRERLTGAQLALLEGDRTMQASAQVAVDLNDWLKANPTDERSATVSLHQRRVLTVRGELRRRIGPAEEAVVAAWIGLDGPVPDQADPSEAEGNEVPSSGAETSGVNVSGAVDPPIDDRADEPAEPEAQEQMDAAVRATESMEAAAAVLWETFYQLGFTDASVELLGDDRPLWRHPERLDPPNTATGLDGPTECGDSLPGSSTFGPVVAAARTCVAGCPADSPGGVCEPQQAKRILLLGFQERLAAFTEAEDVGESQDELLARLDEVREELETIQDPVAVHRLAMIGADEVIGDVVRALVLDDERPARLGGWGWLVLTLAGIVGYRMLEIANGRRSPSPVSVVASDANDETSTKSEAAAALVRAHLTAANLREPSPLPGGEAVASIASSTEAARIENQLVNYVVGVLQNTAFPRRGIDLVVTAQPDRAGLSPKPAVATKPAATGDGDGDDQGAIGQQQNGGAHDDPMVDDDRDDEPYRLMIRASSSRLKGPVFSHLFEGETLSEVTEAAAYFAAERLLDAGWTTPSWLVWSSHDGTALRAYQRVMMEKSSPPQLKKSTDGTGSGVSSCARLRQAVRSSPGTGAALVALSHEEVLEADVPAALYHLLLARVRHERFLTVRYRLGVTLSMIANGIADHWQLHEPDWRTNPDAAGAVRMLEELMPGRWPERLGPDNEQLIKQLLLEQAVAELTFVAESVALSRIMLRAFRQSERMYWLGLLRSPRRQRGLEAAALSARALAERRRIHVSADDGSVLDAQLAHCNADMETALDRASDDWLVRYNAACYAAAVGEELRNKAGRTHGPAVDPEHEVVGHTPENTDEPPEHLDDAPEVAVDEPEHVDGDPEVLDGAAKTIDDSPEAIDRFEEAIDHLRRSSHARNGQQLSAEWTFMDPDLEPLRDYCDRSAKQANQWKSRLGRILQIDDAELRIVATETEKRKRVQRPAGSTVPPAPDPDEDAKPGSEPTWTWPATWRRYFSTSRRPQTKVK